MIAVLFEVEIRSGQVTAYMDLAQELKVALEQVDGFISVERFESVAEPGRYLSLSYWRDEAAARAWHLHPQHAAAQQLGRTTIFERYKISVASIIRCYEG